MQGATKRIVFTAFAAILSWTNSACATDAWHPVSNGQLDELRGGFDAGAGLRISFGINREGYINGELISATSFNISDIAVPAAAIRHGAIHATDAARPAQSAALLIQNSLNLQDIRSLTVINATTNSLDLIKGLQLQAALTDALVQSLGRR